MVRLAFAVFCLLLLIGTCLLWWRSYSHTDQLGRWWRQRGLGYAEIEKCSGLVSQNGDLVITSMHREGPFEFVKMPHPDWKRHSPEILEKTGWIIDAEPWRYNPFRDYQSDWELLGIHWRSPSSIEDGVDLLFGDTLDLWFLRIPFGYVVAILGLMTLLIWIRLIRSWQAYAAGLCQNCGYDLRATPDRCPECGLAVTTNASNA